MQKPIEYDRLTEVLVNVGDRQEVRRIDHLEAMPRGRMARKVPVLNPGEEVAYGADGSIHVCSDGR